VLFVHKYSGGTVLNSAILISLGYFVSTASMIDAQHLTQGISEPPVGLKYPGILLFLIGICGNFYHHLLLSKLREEGEREYRIPRGGLFDSVICTHYLFEIIGFLGISFISQTSYAFSFTLGTMFYLMGRSYATRRWYLSKFEDFSEDVKALIPYVF
jgi:steroid 5-alpha reductase family enzyme